jgi:hypothetical protein
MGADSGVVERNGGYDTFGFPRRSATHIFCELISCKRTIRPEAGEEILILIGVTRQPRRFRMGSLSNMLTPGPYYLVTTPLSQKSGLFQTYHFASVADD